MGMKLIALLMAAWLASPALAADPPKDDKAKKEEKRPWPPQKVPKVIDETKPERVGRKTQDERAAEKKEKPGDAAKKK
ncbi:MAG: hypothetical protein EBU07_00985 [Betaproteobacteria bacterium]|jgi:hypothetical protein|nr:hypothetical protein [Betaproteobacteria bacterium]NBS45506.1 hypothetical protein [Betaproteobacteria bacterium]